jgi:hypothetical protein
MYFATVLDKNYISRAKVMIDSLIENCNNSNLNIFILCLDDDVKNYFYNHKFVTTIELNNVEEYFIELIKVKNNRTYVEYIFTLSPFLPLYILKNFTNIKRITTIDADLFFLSDPSLILDSLGDYKTGITGHSFPNFLKKFEKYGKFNVSFQSFPNTKNGMNILNSWKNSCVEYCSDHLDDFGRFADQKYLDDWVHLYENVIEFPFPYVGLAPWNLINVELKWKQNMLISKKSKLIFYHFHNIRFRSNYHLTTSLQDYGFKKPTIEIKKLYSTYFKKIKKLKIKNDKKLIRNNLVNNNKILNLLKDLKNQIIFVDIYFFNFFIDVRFIFIYPSKYYNKWKKLFI